MQRVCTQSVCVCVAYTHCCLRMRRLRRVPLWPKPLDCVEKHIKETSGAVYVRWLVLRWCYVLGSCGQRCMAGFACVQRLWWKRDDLCGGAPCLMRGYIIFLSEPCASTPVEALGLTVAVTAGDSSKIDSSKIGILGCRRGYHDHSGVAHGAGRWLPSATGHTHAVAAPELDVTIQNLRAVSAGSGCDMRRSLLSISCCFRYRTHAIPHYIM